MVRLLPLPDAEDAEDDTPDAMALLLAEYLDAVRQSMLSDDWLRADSLLTAIEKHQQNAVKGNFEASPYNVDYQRVNAELLYNRLNVFRLCKILYLLLGAALLVFAVILMGGARRRALLVSRCLLAAIILTGIYHIFGIALRGYIAGHAPWSNSYETMTLVALITVIGGVCFARRSMLTAALATLFGGVILFVAGLNWLDPQITPLVPVLQSPWLMFHVAVAMAAYGFFGISFLLGATNLILRGVNHNRDNIKRLTTINEMSMWLGLALMTIGTFLGAVWANESWGRYWGWDPKETWALITIVVYACVTHLHLAKKDNSLIFNVLSVLAFFTVLMTYFGVNYFLSGMHSYGG
jgi:cytochrome c-type biogenesis protein CcsB